MILCGLICLRLMNQNAFKKAIADVCCQEVVGGGGVSQSRGQPMVRKLTGSGQNLGMATFHRISEDRIMVGQLLVRKNSKLHIPHSMP